MHRIIATLVATAVVVVAAVTIGVSSAQAAATCSTRSVAAPSSAFEMNNSVYINTLWSFTCTNAYNVEIQTQIEYSGTWHNASGGPGDDPTFPSASTYFSNASHHSAVLNSEIYFGGGLSQACKQDGGLIGNDKYQVTVRFQNGDPNISFFSGTTPCA